MTAKMLCVLSLLPVLRHRFGSPTYNHSKALPLWNLYFHSPAVNTTSIVIQGQGHCYDLLSIVLGTNEVTRSER